MSRYQPLSSKSRNNVSSAVRLTKLGRLFMILVFLLSLVVGSVTSAAAATITFTGTELLGRPTDTSISVSIVPNCSHLALLPIRHDFRGAVYGADGHDDRFCRAAQGSHHQRPDAQYEVLLPDAIQYR